MAKLIFNVNDQADGGYQTVKGKIEYDLRASNLNPIKTEPLVGLPVTLKDNAGSVIGTDQTDINGEYFFGTLYDGPCTVEVSDPDARAAGLMPQGAESVFDPSTGAAAGNTVTNGVTNLDGRVFHKTYNSVAYNLDALVNTGVMSPLKNKIFFGNLFVGGSQVFRDLVPDPLTGMPTEMPATDGIRFSVLGSGTFSTTHPARNKAYVARHNLDTLAPGTYTVTISGAASNATVTTDRVESTVVPASGGVDITIDGPAGPMPSGWYVEFIPLDGEAELDNTNLDLATRYFEPYYITELLKYAPNHLRFMDANEINNNLETINVADVPTINHRWAHRKYPVDLSIALCNLINCGMYWCEYTNSSPALQDYHIDKILTGLNPLLEVKVEMSNECWNSGFSQTNRCDAIWRRREGTLGTVPFTRTLVDDPSRPNEGRTVALYTGDGSVDLRTIFANPDDPNNEQLTDRFEMNGITYPVQANFTTANELYSFKFSLFPETPGNWYYLPTVTQYFVEGYTIIGAKLAKRWHDEALARGQRHRVRNMVGGRQVATGHARAILEANRWRASQINDFIEPAEFFDGISIAAYYYSGRTEPAVLQKAESLYLENRLQELEQFLYDLSVPAAGTHTIDGVTYFSGWTIDGSLRNYFTSAMSLSAEYGMITVSYEGNDHSIASPDAYSASGTEKKPSADDLVLAYQHFYSSTLGGLCVEAWCDAHKLLDGPAMHFNFAGNQTFYGLWAMLTAPGFEDARSQALEAYTINEPEWFYPS